MYSLAQLLIRSRLGFDNGITLLAALKGNRVNAVEFCADVLQAYSNKSVLIFIKDGNGDIRNLEMTFQ